jgi:hypothetical protein
MPSPIFRTPHLEAPVLCPGVELDGPGIPALSAITATLGDAAGGIGSYIISDALNVPARAITAVLAVKHAMARLQRPTPWGAREDDACLHAAALKAGPRHGSVVR